MGFRITGQSDSRESVVGGLVEAFIDNNENEFSINQIELLESLAEEIDEAAGSLEQELEELKEELEALKDGHN